MKTIKIEDALKLENTMCKLKNSLYDAGIKKVIAVAIEPYNNTYSIFCLRLILIFKTAVKNSIHTSTSM